MRVVYSKSGEPTAAILHDNTALVENVLFWVPCRDTDEANYLLAIINSDALRESVTPLMTKGQFGARDLHKHLWKLPIPEFDGDNRLHARTARAGERAAAGAAKQLEQLREARGDKLTVKVARRELRSVAAGVEGGPGRGSRGGPVAHRQVTQDARSVFWVLAHLSARNPGDTSLSNRQDNDVIRIIGGEDFHPANTHIQLLAQSGASLRLPVFLPPGVLIGR